MYNSLSISNSKKLNQRIFLVTDKLKILKTLENCLQLTSIVQNNLIVYIFILSFIYEE